MQMTSGKKYKYHITNVHFNVRRSGLLLLRYSEIRFINSFSNRFGIAEKKNISETKITIKEIKHIST